MSLIFPKCRYLKTFGGSETRSAGIGYVEALVFGHQRESSRLSQKSDFTLSNLAPISYSCCLSSCQFHARTICEVRFLDWRHWNSREACKILIAKTPKAANILDKE